MLVFVLTASSRDTIATKVKTLATSKGHSTGRYTRVVELFYQCLVLIVHYRAPQKHSSATFAGSAAVDLCMFRHYRYY